VVESPIAVTAPAGCGWTATSGAGWITIASGASGTGNGTVRFTVAANTGPGRTGALTIAGQTFAVTQASGCDATLDPTSRTFTRDPATSTIAVTIVAGCAWTATTSDDWITITAGASGTGNGTVTFTIERLMGNEPFRTGTILVAGKTFTVRQER
jgi:hypothetical protein